MIDAHSHPDLQDIPLVNLHSHLEGSVRPQTYLDLCDQQGVPRPASYEQAEHLICIDGSEKSLVDYLIKIERVLPLLHKHEALERVAFEAVQDAWLDGVRYIEVRAGPLPLATPSFPATEVIGAMLHGLAAAEAQFGITARLIVCALRHHDPHDNEDLARLSASFAGKGVVGFDLAGPEAGYPAKAHARAFAIARAAGLGLTCHAGEATGSHSIVEAVHDLGVRRVGHGVHLDDTSGRLQWAIESEIVLEMCPTSNVDTRAVPLLAAHPIRRYFDAGLKISVGDDDPTTSRTHVAHELSILATEFHFTRSEILTIQRTGLAAAFAERSVVQALWSRLHNMT